MTESENEKIVKELFEAYNRRDIDFIINSFADDLIFIQPSGETIGKDGLPQAYSMLFDVFQDGKWSTPRVMRARWLLWWNTVTRGRCIQPLR